MACFQTFMSNPKSYLKFFSLQYMYTWHMRPTLSHESPILPMERYPTAVL